jgi:hypothetical protein
VKHSEAYRKKKSDAFRLRRFNERMKLYYLALSHPEVSPAELARQRMAIAKNKNRQAAALRRARDNNGKF